MHIAIAGNIGSGKTTLTKLLSKHYGWEPHFEDVEENPYLNDFYNDMQRWSFNLQVYFLNSRFNQILEIRKSGKTIIQDRTIYEDAYIFATCEQLPGLGAIHFPSWVYLILSCQSLENNLVSVFIVLWLFCLLDYIFISFKEKFEL